MTHQRGFLSPARKRASERSPSQMHNRRGFLADGSVVLTGSREIPRRVCASPGQKSGGEIWLHSVVRLKIRVPYWQSLEPLRVPWSKPPPCHQINTGTLDVSVALSGKNTSSDRSSPSTLLYTSSNGFGASDMEVEESVGSQAKIGISADIRQEVARVATCTFSLSVTSTSGPSL